jgi:hypothetical protein
MLFENTKVICIHEDPIIMALPSTGAKFQEIQTQFTNKWTKGTPPNVHAILQIQPPSAVTQRYETYREQIIDARPQYATRGFGSGELTIKLCIRIYDI